MSNIQVSLRIPPVLYKKLIAHAESLGTPKSQVMVRAITQYLESITTEPLANKVIELEQRVSTLETIQSQPLSTPAAVFKAPVPPQTFTFEVFQVDEFGEILSQTAQDAQYFSEMLDTTASMRMIYLPGETFLMGAFEKEPKSQNSEKPQHRVTVSSFFLSQYPITQKQWRIVADFPQVRLELHPDPSHFKGDERPVERINWEEAVEFCARLSNHTQRPYRLPTEAEWEYACRGRTTTPFHFGETLTGKLANYMAKGAYKAEKLTEYRQETTPVGIFLPNAFGLYDMHGNVWEWCADHWHPNYLGAPIWGEAWLSDNPNDHRLLRGGSWDFNPENCRSASRFAYHPRAMPLDQIGVRVACDLRGW